MAQHHFDIAVVGGGVAGATLAALLGLKAPSLSIALIDAGAPLPLELGSYDARVTAFSKASEAVFRDIEVWEQVLALRACPYFEMEVWDGEGSGSIHFDCHDIHMDCLGHIVENKVIAHVLAERLKTLPSVARFSNSKVEDMARKSEQSTLQLKGDEHPLTATLIVAADGAESSLRRLAGFALREWDYGQTAIVSTVKVEKNHKNTAWQRFSATGPLALLPLADGEDAGHFCSIVWSLDHAQAEAMLSLDDVAFCSALSKSFEYRLGKIVSVDKRYAFPLRQRHAKRYAADGLVLVGDAAHTIHPLAGQGANLGIYDVKVLAEEIIRAQERGFSLADMSIARRYQRRRQPQNLLTMAAMDGFKRLFGSEQLPVLWMRNEGLRIVNKMPWLKNQFSRVAGEYF